jgi:hypothetical protein
MNNPDLRVRRAVAEIIGQTHTKDDNATASEARKGCSKGCSLIYGTPSGPWRHTRWWLSIESPDPDLRLTATCATFGILAASNLPNLLTRSQPGPSPSIVPATLAEWLGSERCPARVACRAGATTQLPRSSRAPVPREQCELADTPGSHARRLRGRGRSASPCCDGPIDHESVVG